MPPPQHPPLSTLLPPLILGTATFNTQYNLSVSSLPTNSIVARALRLGIRAFDTAPYYGPSESLLGTALHQPGILREFPRESYMLLTKVGRVRSDCFDYSPEWVRRSVVRSCERLNTGYLDVVYLHDVEFVGEDEVLEAVRVLRRLRDEDGCVRYVGISGYPVDVLVRLAEWILAETGEPIDVVQSFGHCTVQNARLQAALDRFVEAGVDVVTNASVLNMGLLRRSGVPTGGQGDWHPAPTGLRAAVAKVSDELDAKAEKLETVAIRYAVETWMRAAEEVGSRGDPALGDAETTEERPASAIAPGVPPRRRLGVSVMGVSQIEELDETLRVWRSVLLTMMGDQDKGVQGTVKSSYGDLDGDWHDVEWGHRRRQQVLKLAEEIKTSLGEWYNYSWPSPPEGFVNTRHEELAS